MALAVVLAATGATACRGRGAHAAGKGSPAVAYTPYQAYEQAQYAYAACMRANGLPNFPNPTRIGNGPQMGFKNGPWYKSSKLSAARAQCQPALRAAANQAEREALSAATSGAASTGR